VWSINHKKNQQKQANSVWHSSDTKYYWYSRLHPSPLTSAASKPLQVSVLLWQLCCFICPSRFLCLLLCQIDCGLCSLLMLQCEENTPSPGSLAASPLLWLAAIKRQWHHPFSFTLFSPLFILWPFLYCLHPDFPLCIPLVQEEKFSQAEEWWHVKCREVFYGTITGFLLIVWWACVLRMGNICYAN